MISLRHAILWVLAALLWTSSVQAQQALLTEDDVTRRAGEHEAYETLRGAAKERGEAEVVGAKLWENPELTYERQQLLGSGANSQDRLVVSQRFDISGARGHRGDAARHRAEASAQRLELRRVDRESQARVAFYEVMHGQNEVEVLEAWVASLEAALESVAKREVAGDASRYERARLESELHRARTRVASASLSRDMAWEWLEWLAGDLAEEGAPWPRLAGTLLPEPPPSEIALAQHGEVRAYEAERSAARSDGEAASLGWVPWLEVGAGYLHQDTGVSDLHGFELSLTLPIPALDREQDASLDAEARARAAQAESELSLERLDASARITREEVVERVQIARAFGAETQLADDVVVIAEAGYGGGELRISELLDAHQHRADVQLERIGLEHEARRAELAWRRLASGVVEDTEEDARD